VHESGPPVWVSYIIAEAENYNPREETMSAAIPQQYLDLFEKRAFANLATLMPNGAPR
jgi:hypothetical protein